MVRDYQFAIGDITHFDGTAPLFSICEYHWFQRYGTIYYDGDTSNFKGTGTTICKSWIPLILMVWDLNFRLWITQLNGMKPLFYIRIIYFNVTGQLLFNDQYHSFQKYRTNFLGLLTLPIFQVQYQYFPSVITSFFNGTGPFVSDHAYRWK